MRAIDIKQTSGKGLLMVRNKLEKYYLKGSNLFIYLFVCLFIYLLNKREGEMFIRSFGGET
jgi:hypothetical protein